MTSISPADLTSDQLAQMRAFARVLVWPNLNSGDVDRLTDAEVASVIATGYEGGVPAFLQHLPH